MKNKKTFIIAVCTVAVMLATIVGLTLYSSSNRKNNIQKVVAEVSYYFDKYKFLPMFYSYEDGIHVSGSAKEFDYYNNQYEEIKSVELEVNGQKSTFVNKKLNQIHYEDEQQN